MASPSDATVRLLSWEATERSRNIFSCLQELRDILDRYEPMTRTRWMKKSAAQRKAILLEAWPGMAQLHHPHLKAYRRDKDLQARTDDHHRHIGHTRFRDAYMWPSINLEDLQKGNTLLHFINARGRHPPGIFAHVDAESVNMGVRFGVIATRTYDNVGSYEMDMDGDSPGTYGRIEQYRYQTPDLKFESTRMDADRGMVVLEIQERILEFLTRVPSLPDL